MVWFSYVSSMRTTNKCLAFCIQLTPSVAVQNTDKRQRDGKQRRCRVKWTSILKRLRLSPCLTSTATVARRWRKLWGLTRWKPASAVNRPCKQWDLGRLYFSTHGINIELTAGLTAEPQASTCHRHTACFSALASQLTSLRLQGASYMSGCLTCLKTADLCK